jgi:hypothetical protein
MWDPSVPVGKALSIIVQTKTSGVVLPTALNESWDRALLQKKGVPCPSHPPELRPPAMTADQVGCTAWRTGQSCSNH